MKSISVCMTVFGVSPHLHEQLRSISVQSYKISELVVIEDYSGFPSPKLLLDAFCAQNNIKFVYRHMEVNVGPANAFRLACLNSTGDIVVFCDHDDIWMPDRVGKAVDKHQFSELVYCNGLLFRDPSDLTEMNNCPKIYDCAISNGLWSILRKNMLVGATISIDGYLVRSVALKFGFQPMHDWNLSAYCALKSTSICFIKEPLIMYRRHSNTFTGLEGTSFFRKLTFRINLLRFLFNVL